MCLLAVLGSQGIVVKCTAAIFFRTVDYKLSCVNRQKTVWQTNNNNIFFAH